MAWVFGCNRGNGDGLECSGDRGFCDCLLCQLARFITRQAARGQWTPEQSAAAQEVIDLVREHRNGNLIEPPTAAPAKRGRR